MKKVSVLYKIVTIFMMLIKLKLGFYSHVFCNSVNLAASINGQAQVESL